MTDLFIYCFITFYGSGIASLYIILEEFFIEINYYNGTLKQKQDE